MYKWRFESFDYFLICGQDYSHEFRKTKSNIHAHREREDLLGSVRRDIEWVSLIGCFTIMWLTMHCYSAYKSSSGVNNRRTDMYLKENEHLRKWVFIYQPNYLVVCVEFCSNEIIIVAVLRRSVQRVAEPISAALHLDNTGPKKRSGNGVPLATRCRIWLP